MTNYFHIKSWDTLWINYIDVKFQVDDGKDHFIVLRWTNDTVQMVLDDNACTNEVQPSLNKCFLQMTTHDMTHHYLNTNGPLHVGGVSFGGDRFGQIADLIGLDRKEMPNGKSYAGCIRNLTFSANGQHRVYDLANPADGEGYHSGCDMEYVQAVKAFGINPNFLIAIAVCLAVAIILIILLAVYRKRRNVFG